MTTTKKKRDGLPEMPLGRWYLCDAKNFRLTILVARFKFHTGDLDVRFSAKDS